MVIWILCASQSQVKVFKCIGMNHPLSIVWHMDHPEGRLHTMEVITDHPGSKHALGNKQHGTSTEETPKEHLAEQFALKISKILHEANASSRFDSLIVCAEPSFLGLLREVFDLDVCARVSGTLVKNLTSMTAPEIFDEVRNLLVETYSPKRSAA